MFYDVIFGGRPSGFVVSTEPGAIHCAASIFLVFVLVYLNSGRFTETLIVILSVLFPWWAAWFPRRS
ncbi:hypothetical protein [Nitrosomonas sp.]|uniref:hypothetical protein n=1 Tax=Nitrosomonas sp. TaxID=42353 RepID=UPI0032ED1A31